MTIPSPTKEHPPEDSGLVELFNRVFNGTPCDWLWHAAPTGTRTRSALEAADALGINPARIAKTMICRWKLSPLAAWTPLTVFVPGDTDEIDFLMLQSSLGVAAVELLPRKDVRRITGFAPGAMPPVFLPAVVDQRLIDAPDKNGAGEIFVSGLTEGGLYRLFTQPGSTNGNRLIFGHLLGEFDEFLPEMSGCVRNPQPVLSTPLFEPLMGALLGGDFAAVDGSNVNLWRELFNWSKDFGADLEDDVGYWARRKDMSADRKEAGDNDFFARMCQAIARDACNAHTDEEKLRAFLAGTNLMLVVRAGSMTRMVFPLAITVYERFFFPFAARESRPSGWNLYELWGHQHHHDFTKTAPLNRREFLRYCRLTQYTQVDISFVGDPRRGSKSQTARTLREGVFYRASDDNIQERKRGEAAGQDVDEELGIRSLFYLRLFPPGSGDLDEDKHHASIYLFGISPFSRWFFNPFSSPPPEVNPSEWKIERANRWKTARLKRNHPLYGLSQKLQHRVAAVRGLAQLMGNQEAVELKKQTYVFDDLRRTAQKEARMDVRELVTKMPHGVWWHILLDYHATKCSLKKLVEQFRKSGLGYQAGKACPTLFRLLTAPDDESVYADADCIVQILRELWQNCSEHGDAEHCEIHIGRWDEEGACYLALSNQLQGNCPDINSYLRLRQRFPHSSFDKGSAGNGENRPPRGFFLLMTDLAFAARAEPGAEATDAAPVDVWIAYGLKRSLVPGTPPYVMRPVARRPDGSLGAAPVGTIWKEWETRICFDLTR